MSKFNELQDANVKALVENVDYAKATAHATFSADSIEKPENITPESIESHIGFFNSLGGLVEVATAQVGRQQHAENPDLTTVDGTLKMGSLVITSQHHLQQKVGDEALYGVSTTAIDYIHSDEQTDWLMKAREVNREEAAKLFNI